MPNRKVIVNRLYRYEPVLIDLVDRQHNIKQGDRVRVVNLPGCPKANTMRHCYVQHLDGTFAGLVSTNSLKDIA